jgi:hypothetical protein
VLKAINNLPNSWFKFVVMSGEDIIEIQKTAKEVGISFDHIILMSEGTQADKLAAKDAQLKEIAQRLGCLTTARNQIFWFGNERRK